MKKRLIVATLLIGLLGCAIAMAQDAPLRGIGLLALNASDAQSLGGAPGSRSAVLDAPDGGGGGGGAVTRNGRGSGDIGGGAVYSNRAAPSPQHVPDALPPALDHGDPATSVAPTPKRPSYRWQSLVPGAIK
jgi:hypothetical protein